MSKLIANLRSFAGDEFGGVTVEWVTIAAAVVVGAAATTWAILDAVDGVGVAITASLTDVANNPVPDSPFGN